MKYISNPPEEDFNGLSRDDVGLYEDGKVAEGLEVIAFGKMVQESILAAAIIEKEQGKSIHLVNARFAKPLDEEMLIDIMNRFKTIITVEDGQIQGGFGSAIAEFAAEHGYHGNLLLHGIPDIFVDHGTQEELLQELKLDARGIADIVSETL